MHNKLVHLTNALEIRVPTIRKVMRYIFILGFVFLFGCNSVMQTKEHSEETKATDNANQHMAVGVSLAIYYCDVKHWPKDEEALEAYVSEKQLPLPVTPNWNWLSRPGVSFNFGENVTLMTPAGETEDDIAVSSINKPPTCEGKSVNVDISINLGE